MNQYLVRDNETYEPLAMFPAPDGISAGVLMRKLFANKPVHVINMITWSQKQKEAALIEIISNCPTAQLLHFPS